jgi:hypothetical protein
MSGGALRVEPERQRADVMAKRRAPRCHRTHYWTSYTLSDLFPPGTVQVSDFVRN